MTGPTCWASRGAAAGAAVCAEPAGPGAPPGAGGHRDRRADGAGASAGAGEDADAAAASGPGYAAQMAGELYGGSARRDPAVARDLLHLTSRLDPARGYYYQLLSGLGWTSLPRLRRLQAPTLILAGDDNPIIPLVNARIMHRLIPNSTLHVYSGGHLELAVDAERIAQVVEAFLTAEEVQDDTGSLASISANRSGPTSSPYASSSPTSSGRTSSPSGGSSTRRSSRSSARTGNGRRSRGSSSGGCPRSASWARTSRDTGVPG
jgi:hypothetical protein